MAGLRLSYLLGLGCIVFAQEITTKEGEPSLAPTTPPTPLLTKDITPHTPSQRPVDHEFVRRVSLIGIAICASLLVMIGTYRFVRTNCVCKRAIESENNELGESLYTVHTEDEEEDGIAMTSIGEDSAAAPAELYSTL